MSPREALPTCHGWSQARPQAPLLELLPSVSAAARQQHHARPPHRWERIPHGRIYAFPAPPDAHTHAHIQPHSREDRVVRAPPWTQRIHLRSSEVRKRSECEDSFDYVGSSSSWIRSSSKRDLRQDDHFPGYHYYHCHARCLVSIACLATYHLYVKPPKLP